jgi:hypothetical protein
MIHIWYCEWASFGDDSIIIQNGNSAWSGMSPNYDSFHSERGVLPRRSRWSNTLSVIKWLVAGSNLIDGIVRFGLGLSR